MKYIRELEGLRGIMAWWVVVGHWSTTALIPHAIGKTKLFNGYAVDVFVILSGFAIAALIDKKPERYGMFIARRVLRIFPVYLFFLIVSALLAPLILETWLLAPDGYMKGARAAIAADTLSQFWLHIVAHVVGLHGLVPPALLPNTDFAILGQAWSISLEWQFYLIAPFMIAFIRPSAPLVRITWLLAITVASVALAPFMPAGFIGPNLHNFIIGIFSYTFLKHRFEGEPALQFSVVPIAVFGIPVLLLFRTVGVLPYAIWLTVMVLIIVSREQAGGVFSMGSRLLTHPLALSMGSMAYSVYLSHMLVIVLALRLLHETHLGSLAFSAALLALTLIGTLIVSTLTYRLIEKPFHEIGRSLRDRRVAKDDQAGRSPVAFG